MEKSLLLPTSMMGKTRTAGDGMESQENLTEIARNKRTNVDSRKNALLPGRLIQVFPSNCIKSTPKKSINSKTPKFVPYEPYPGAVKPIKIHQVSKSKKSKNNMDINMLISQMAQMNTNLNEFKPRPKQNSVGDKSLATETDLAGLKIDEFQKKIDEMTLENQCLNEQLKQQVQVNKELKTMLVASMGEDIEIQVQSLNEDKKHLANALLNSAQHLSTHQEQTEWLAGQCEVWRSKFLASSLMVEELANCKRHLYEKAECLEQAIKQLLDEKCRVRDMLLCTYRNLYSLHEKKSEDIRVSEYTGINLYNSPPGNFNAGKPHSTNLIDMASINLKISEGISSSVMKCDVSHLNNLPTMTDGERNAENVMAMPLEVKIGNDVPVNALVHHAYSNSGNTPKPVASCAHCSGRVQLL